MYDVEVAPHTPRGVAACQAKASKTIGGRRGGEGGGGAKTNPLNPETPLSLSPKPPYTLQVWNT